MKLKPVAWTVGLLALAALLGWLLPAIAFPERDNTVEEAARPIEIRRVDLRYDSDLSTADRLRLIREYERNVLPLEHGVILSREEVYSILDAFLYNLTGSSVPISEETCSAQPALMSFNESGTFVVWAIRAVSIGEWEIEAFLDDQSGVLLQCVMTGNPSRWGSAFPHIDSADDPVVWLREQVRTAVRSQLRRRLSDAWSVELQSVEQDWINDYSTLHLLNDGVEVCSLPVIICFDSGVITLNR